MSWFAILGLDRQFYVPFPLMACNIFKVVKQQQLNIVSHYMKLHLQILLFWCLFFFYTFFLEKGYKC